MKVTPALMRRVEISAADKAADKRNGTVEGSTEDEDQDMALAAKFNPAANLGAYHHPPKPDPMKPPTRKNKRPKPRALMGRKDTT